MLVHQLLMSPVFGIGTPDSVAVETMKNEYVRLSGHARTGPPTSSHGSRQLEEALRDMPDWSVVPERDVRRDALLADIKTALEKRR